MSGRRARRFILMGAVLLAGCASGEGVQLDDGVGGAVDTVPGADARQEPEEPGGVVDIRPLGTDVVPDGARGWAITYLSEGVHGDVVQVGGVVFAPEGEAPAEGRPVLAWGHGGGETVGVADQCAPTQKAAVTIPFADELIDAGFVVAATDYEGLGSEGVHPYLVGTSGARGMLDAARAATAVPGAGAGEQVLLFGHVGGGQAAVIGGTMIEDYAPELELLGVAAGAPPLELRPMLTVTAQHASRFGIFAMAVKGYDYAYEDLDAADLLTPEGVEALEVVSTSCEADVKAHFEDRDVASLVATPPQEHERWMQRIAENEPGDKVIPAPVLLVHGEEDTNILSIMTQIATTNMCQAGNTVKAQIVPGEEQETILEATKGDILTWIQGRLEGSEPPSSC